MERDDEREAAGLAATQASGDPLAGVAGEAIDVGQRFVLERALGSGGMGTAWLARDTLLLRPCVIKVLHGAAELDAEKVERFLREARITARLRHPHIVTTYDLGLSPARVPFLVLEELEGRALDRVLREEGPLPLLRTVAIGVQVLRGLAAAHAAGVVHHDIKPANVFVQKNGVAKLLDFGVAAFVGKGGEAVELGSTAPTGGTPYYMAPEQFSAETSDPRSDVWAVGILLYELRLGRPPFVAESWPALLAQIAADDPVLPRPREAGEAELFGVIRRALEQSAAARWASAAVMLEALEQLWESLSRGASATLERSAGGALPAPITDADVQFTVYQPEAIAPAAWSKLVTFAHRALDPGEAERVGFADPLAEVQRRAHEVLGDAIDQHQPERAASPMRVPREHELTFAPAGEGLVFDPPSRTFLWSEPVHREVFLVRPEDGGTAERSARMQVFLGALLLAEVRFVLRIGAASPREERASARPFTHVFVSYASEDDVVATQIKALTAALTGTRYAESSVDERRAQALGASGRGAIESAEAVQLLWSDHAMRSPLVDQELRFAIAERGAAIVRPVCWQSPAPVDVERDKPPAALRELGWTTLVAPANALLAAITSGAMVAPAPPSFATVPAPGGGMTPASYGGPPPAYGAPASMPGSAPPKVDDLRSIGGVSGPSIGSPMSAPAPKAQPSGRSGSAIAIVIGITLGIAVAVAAALGIWLSCSP